MKPKRIAYITGTRAEFGIITPLLQAFEASNDYILDVYATGMHLMDGYGYTFTIVQQAFPKVKQLRALYEPNSTASTAQFLAELFPILVTSFMEHKPDMVLVHGDRAEMLAVATVCLYLHIPVIHTQGGDISATDDNTARHAITKLSFVHFPATEQAKQNIVALGEPENRIHVVGTLSLDTIKKVLLLSQQQALNNIGLPHLENYIIVTQHPVSEEVDKAADQMKLVIEASRDTGLPLLIVYPNADAGSQAMIQVIEQFSSQPNIYIFKNIDYQLYISVLSHASVWIGNSSAGIVDSPYLKVPVVNVGIRQQGRELSSNILSVPPERTAIKHALNTALTNQHFQKVVETCKNEWGDGTAVEKIMSVLSTARFDESLLHKGKI